MQDDDGSDGTMVINARELLTAADCESIIRCDGCSVGYAWPPEEKPSPAMCARAHGGGRSGPSSR